MEEDAPNELEKLWEEYGRLYASWDDQTLARWMAQTLGQFEGHVLRKSHPLVGAYGLAAGFAHERSAWLKRLATAPSAYPEAPCCRAPLFPMVTRDLRETGLICLHCGGTAVPFDEIDAKLRAKLAKWAEDFAPVHHVAHWDDREQASVANYDKEYEAAAQRAEAMLATLAKKILPEALNHYPAVVWDDQDECLEVLPQDIEL